MNKCSLVRKLMMAYIYDLLSDKERREIEAHLKGCVGCSDALNSLRKAQTVMSRSNRSEKAPDDLQTILIRAKKIESEMNGRTIPFFSIFKKLIKSSAVKMAAAGVFAAAVILVSAVWLSSGNINYLYMTRAYGDVKVNDKKMFVAENYIYRLEIDKPVKIGVGQGQCEFQINKNKYFEMRPLTRILVEKGKDIIVNFLEGLLIGKVIYDQNAIGLQIVAPNRNAVFSIIGTVFYVKSTNREIEFAVKEGTVRVEGNATNRPFTVHGSEIVRVGDDFVKFLTNTNSQNSNMESVFDRLDQYVIRKDFNNVRQIMIKTEPADSEIYWKEKQIGRSPLFLIGNRDQYKSLTVVKKGYVSQEIEIGNNNVYDVKIKHELPPEVIWNMGMPGTRFISPVVASDGALLVGDESGWFYKLDPVSKKILWKFKAGLRNNSLPLAVDKIVYFSSTDEYLYAVNYDTGELVWKQKVGIMVYSGPQYSNGRVFIGNIEGNIMSLEASSGRILWSKKFDDGFYTSPLIKNGNIYIGATSGNIYSIRADNGNINWRYRTGDRIISSRPYISDKKVFFGSNDKNFYALDVDTGKLLWSVNIGGEIFTSSVDWDDAIVICSLKGDIYSLNKKDGSVIWSFKTGKKILLNPYLVRGKNLFVSAEKTLYIFNKWGLLFTQYPFENEIADFTVSADKDVYLCGREGDMRLVRFFLD